MEEKYLPIGTVVLLKNGTKPIMITGYLPISSESADTTMYDYSACIFPEGLLSSDQNSVFNHEQIAKIIFMGFKNEESIYFLNEVKNIANLYREEQLGITKNNTMQSSILPQSPQIISNTPIVQPLGNQTPSNQYKNSNQQNSYPQPQQQVYSSNNNVLSNNDIFY